MDDSFGKKRAGIFKRSLRIMFRSGMSTHINCIRKTKSARKSRVCNIIIHVIGVLIRHFDKCVTVFGEF
jgi:hypothetical protein